jgi:opacity protein-like surface antigen
MSVILLMAVAALGVDSAASTVSTTASVHNGGSLAMPLNLGLAEEAPKSVFGAADSWRFNLWGGYANDFDHDEQGHAGIGVSWFFIENLSLDLEGNGLYFDQEGDNAWGGNFNLMFRWHFLMREKWSVYADIGAGMLGTSDDVPFNGTSFNFTPQVGAGVSYEIASNVRLMTGVRWHHISNARTSDDNPGRDSLMVYAGVSFPF